MTSPESIGPRDRVQAKAERILETNPNKFAGFSTRPELMAALKNAKDPLLMARLQTGEIKTFDQKFAGNGENIDVAVQAAFEYANDGDRLVYLINDKSALNFLDMGHKYRVELPVEDMHTVGEYHDILEKIHTEIKDLLEKFNDVEGSYFAKNKLHDRWNNLWKSGLILSPDNQLISAVVRAGFAAHSEVSQAPVGTMQPQSMLTLCLGDKNCLMAMENVAKQILSHLEKMAAQIVATTKPAGYGRPLAIAGPTEIEFLAKW